MNSLPCVEFSSRYREAYSQVPFVLGAVWQCSQKDTGHTMDGERERLEQTVRDQASAIERRIKLYASFFKLNGFKCPLLGQFHNTRKKGLPHITPYVDVLLSCEMAHGVLMGLQDNDEVPGGVLVDVATKGERFEGMHGVVTCHENEIVLRSQSDIIASYFQGPDSKTSVNKCTTNVLLYGFLAPDVAVGDVEAALHDAVAILNPDNSRPSDVQVFTARNLDEG